MNKKITTYIVYLAVAIALCAGMYFFSTDDNKSAEVSTVKIASLPNAHGLPVYLALDKGYFKDAGIDVELVRFEAPNQIIDALLQGQVDLSHPGGAAGIVGIANHKNPGKMHVYALAGGDTKTIQNDAMLVQKDSKIQSIADLKGKKLGIMAGTIQWQTITREILSRYGLEYGKDVTIVELALGLHTQALASGEVDAVLAVEPVPTVIKAKGIGRELAPFAAAKHIADPFYAGAGIIRSDFVKENPEVAQKVLNVIDKAMKEINTNPDVARQYLKGHTQLDESTIANVPILTFKMYSDLSHSDIDAVQKFYDIFTKWNVVDGAMNFSDLLYKAK